jgi:patatin-like phospholipase/acyl hydrolase
MAKFRILAMDGGNGLNTALLLNEISSQLTDERQDFLEGVKLFAGTSAGAINSLFFAKHRRQRHALSDIFKYQQNIYLDILDSENPFNLLGAFAGFNALASTNLVRRFYIEYFGEKLSLHDLHHKVLVVTFVLDNQQPPPHRRWEPRIFTNLPDSQNAQELVVDVLMRSSALPIAYPIFQSITGQGPAYIDGAVVANNPAMFALVHALEHADLDDIMILSVGTGRNVIGNADFVAPTFKDGIADWGYQQWLLDSADPLLLVDMLIQGGEESVSFECSQLLGNNHYRLNVDLQHGRVAINEPKIEAQVKAAVDWLNTSGWFDDEGGQA